MEYNTSKPHLLKKLYNREIYGSFVRNRSVQNKAMELFSSVPDRLVFPLSSVIQNMKKQIYLGTSRCGKFLLTYSFTYEISQAHLAFRYKYRLHWYAYRPGAPATKVAEVQLFDSQDIKFALNVSVAQWPNVNDKLVVYGYSDDSESLCALVDGDTETRRYYYITVTTLPSLHNCKDCKSVAESFDEEDMAANWDSCIVLSCLKHGLTIHTTLDIAYPYPSMDFSINLKIDNKIIVNTVNFLHVLTFANDQQEIKPSHNDTIVSEDLQHNVGEKLSTCLSDYICPWKTKPTLSSRKMLTRSTNKAWLNTIMARAEKVYAFDESEDGCEPRFKWFKKRRIADKMYAFCSDEDDDIDYGDDENMENICPPNKKLRNFGSSTYLALKNRQQECRLVRKGSREESHVEEFRSSSDLDRRDSFCLSEKTKYMTESMRGKQMEIDSKRRQMETYKKCVSPSDSCDNDTSNECDTQGLEDSSIGSWSSEKTVVDNVSYKSDCDNVYSPLYLPSTPSKSDFHKPSLDVSIINPDLSAMLAEWEADSIPSLSPNSDGFLSKTGETRSDVIQSFTELIPGMTISPRGSNSNSQRTLEHSWEETGSSSSQSSNRTGSPNCKYPPLLVVLRARNCNKDEGQRPKEPAAKEDKVLSKEEGAARGKSTKEPDLVMRQRMISGCSIKFDRIYIEVDEEIMSTITDIEDDDQGSGFHCALPLSVHGSAYAQLQMVSSQKVERMNIHCERVYQASLDIEQFCFKAAQIICKCEGFKFWFCNDYDVGIIDVCSLTGDILGVVCLRLNAEKKPPVTERYSVLNQRFFYEVRCVFTWNPATDRCWLEAYSHLEDVTNVRRVYWAPACREAERLQDALRESSNLYLNGNSTLRILTHRLWSSSNFLVPSLESIIDHTNLIGFCLVRRKQ